MALPARGSSAGTKDLPCWFLACQDSERAGINRRQAIPFEARRAPADRLLAPAACPSSQGPAVAGGYLCAVHQQLGRARPAHGEVAAEDLRAPRGATQPGGGERTLPSGLSQQAGEAGDSPTWEALGRVGAAPTTTGRAGTARRPRVRQARREGVREEPAVKFTWHRVLIWLRHKHKRVSWKWLRGRYLPGWRPTDGKAALLHPAAVTVSRYRYRGQRIPSPWSATATGQLPTHRHGPWGEPDARPTGTSGSEEQAGKTTVSQERHRVPA